MSKRKVCIVVASRANYGRIKSVMEAVRDHPDLELQLVVSASALLYRFGNAIEVIRRDGFEPDATVFIVIEGENPTTMAKSTGLAIIELGTIFQNLQPDIVLTVADRYETMATAVAASYMNIPLAHTQGGEVTGSIDESVRHAVTKLAHIHFPATERAAENLVRMGEDPATIFNTGCPSLDIVRTTELTLTQEIMNRYGGTGAGIDVAKPFILVLQHPVTTEFESGMHQINQTIEAVDTLGMQTIWLWPNVDAGSDDIAKGLRLYREKRRPDFVHFFRNFTPEDYVRVLNTACCIVGNSSSGLREGALLGTPCVNIGSRQNNRERGPNVIDAPYDAPRILEAIRTHLDHGRYPATPIYGDGNAGKRIADILAKADLSIQKVLQYPL